MDFKLRVQALVAILVLVSGLIMVIPSVQSASAGTAILSFNVVDNTNTPVAGATATLTETHTSKVYTNTTDASGLVTFSPLPGYYILKISKTGFFDLEYASVVKFDGITSVTLGLVQIANLPAGTGTLALSVTRAVGGTPVVGSLKVIDLNSPTKMEKIYAFSGTLNLPLYPSSYGSRFFPSAAVREDQDTKHYQSRTQRRLLLLVPGGSCIPCVRVQARLWQDRLFLFQCAMATVTLP